MAKIKKEPTKERVYSCRALKPDGSPYRPWRSYKSIDEKEVMRLAESQCTMKEMARLLHTSVETLHHHFRDAIDYGRCLGTKSVRRKQYEVAMEGSPTMLQWLGKHWLQQKDDVAEAIAKAPFLETMAALTQAYKVDISDTKEKKLDEIG